MKYETICPKCGFYNKRNYETQKKKLPKTTVCDKCGERFTVLPNLKKKS